MPDTDLPRRLAWPITVTEDGTLATVEQDSDQDIRQCMVAILRTRPGDRPDLPEMGIPDPAFSEEPVDLGVIQETLARHEPRAAVTLRNTPILTDFLNDIGVIWQPAAGQESE